MHVRANILDNLFEKQRPFITIDRVKNGVQKTKAFVSKIAHPILKDLKEDYIFLLKSVHEEGNEKLLILLPSIKDKRSAISREHFTRTINKDLLWLL